MKIQNLNIHLTWIIILLISGLAAFVVYSPSGSIVQDYTSFASTITSLVLAVVAIVYTMLSNQGLSETIGAIKESASDIRDETRSLSDTSKDVFNDANQLLDRLRTLPDSVDQLRTDLNEKLVSPLTGTDRHGDTSKNLIDPKGGSIGAALAMYCVKRSADTLTPIKPHKVFDNNELNSVLYGYLNALKQFSPQGMQVDGVSSEFLVRNLGNFEFNEIEETLEKSKNEAVMHLLPQAKAYFAREEDNQHDARAADNDIARSDESEAS